MPHAIAFRKVTWKPVAGFAGFYEVSSDGQVMGLGRVIPNPRRRATFPAIVLKLKRVRGGYLSARLYDATGTECSLFVHRIVLEAFVGPAPDGYIACHNNGIPDDNRIANLRWDTVSANSRDAVQHGALRVGERHHNSRLNDSDVKSIRDSYSRNHPRVTLSALASKYGVSVATISRAVNRRLWSHVQ